MLVRDVELPVSVDDLAFDAGGHRHPRGPPALRVPRVQHPLRPPGRGHRHRPRALGQRGHGARGRGGGGGRRRPRRRGCSPRWPPAATEPLAMAAGWTGVEGRSPLEGIAVVVDGAAGEVRVDPRGPADRRRRCATRWRALAGVGGRPLAAHQAKPLVRALTGLDVDVRSLALDTALAAYLIDPAESRYLLEELVVRYAGARIPEGDAAAEGQLDLEGSSTPGRPRSPPAGPSPSTAWSAPLQAALDAQGLRALHDDIEVPLVGVLARMEDLGVGRRRRRAAARSATGWWRTATACAGEIVAAAGHDFNVNSTPQLRQVLFDELGPRPAEEDEDRLLHRRRQPREAGRPAPDHRAPARATARSRSSARPTATGLLAEVGPDGRIHATFNQTVARTGRLSSDQPNLHNIPVRSELGREFRRAFVPAPGHKLLVADYNQIELRCIAHLAEDPGLIESFESGRDIHTETAARIFARRGGATSPSRCGRRRRWSPTASPTAWRPTASASASTSPPTRRPRSSTPTSWPSPRCGTTWSARSPRPASGATRRRSSVAAARSPSWPPSNFRIRQAGERQAMNAGIQGLAADIFKVALVRLDARLAEEDPASQLILQVHDEVLLEVPPAHVDAAGRPRHRGPVGRRPAAGAAGGQPLRRRQLGRGQGLSRVAEDHWFEPIADHLGSAYLRYSFTKGTEQEVAFLVEALGLEPGQRVLDVGLRPRPPRPRPGRAGDRGPRGRHQPALRRPGRGRRSRRGHLRPGRRPPALRFDGEFDAAISLCQGAFGLTGGPGPRSTPTGSCWPGWPGPLRPGRAAGRVGVLLVLPDPLPGGPGRVRRRGRGQPRAHGGEGRGRSGTPTSTCGRPASRPGSCASWPRPAASRSTTLWSVTPGAYRRDPPSLDTPEYLLVAHRP